MAKYLVLVLVIVLVVWFLRRGRPAKTSGDPPSRSRRPALPQAVVPCAHCGLHLPAGDAVAGEQGLHYCSEDHRRAGPR